MNSVLWVYDDDRRGGDVILKEGEDEKRGKKKSWKHHYQHQVHYMTICIRYKESITYRRALPERLDSSHYRVYSRRHTHTGTCQAHGSPQRLYGWHWVGLPSTQRDGELSVCVFIYPLYSDPHIAPWFNDFTTVDIHSISYLSSETINAISLDVPRYKTKLSSEKLSAPVKGFQKWCEYFIYYICIWKQGREGRELTAQSQLNWVFERGHVFFYSLNKIKLKIWLRWNKDKTYNRCSSISMCKTLKELFWVRHDLTIALEVNLKYQKYNRVR